MTRWTGGHARLRRWTIPATLLVVTGTVLPAAGGSDPVARAASPQVRSVGASAAVPALRSPAAVAVAPDGTVYIANTAYSQVVALAPNGTLSVVPTSTLDHPYGVAVDSSGNLFIADTYNNRIVEEPAGGGTESTVASNVMPYGIAADNQGNVVFTDWPAGLVMKVPASGGTPTAVTLTGVTNPTSVVGKLYGLAVDAQGNIFGTDSNGVSRAGYSVWEISPNGSTNTVVKGLKAPQGVATDGRYVYVADAGHNQVLKVSLSDQTQTTVGTGLNYPSGVAVDAAGNVYIADTNNNLVVKVTPGGTQTTIAGQDPNATPPPPVPVVGVGGPATAADAVQTQIGPGETEAISVVGKPNALATADIITASGYPRTAVLYRPDGKGRFLGSKKAGMRMTKGQQVAYRYSFHLRSFQGRGCALLTFTIPTRGALGPAAAPVKVVSPKGHVTHPGGALGAHFTVVVDPKNKPGSLHPTSPAQLAVIARKACLGQI